MKIGYPVGLLLFVAACTTTRTASEYVPKPEYHIIAYVRDSNQLDLATVDAHRLTHVNYAFADVSPEHRMFFRNESDAAALRKLTSLRKKNPNLKILVSAGGWGWSDHFSDAALTDSSRRVFAESAVQLVREHDLDGVDIDWEYPGLPGDNNKHRPEDRENFTLMLKALREHLDALAPQLGRELLLTIAAGAGQYFIDHTEIDEVVKFLDLVNLMTYDFAGAWSDHTTHHTNLYDSACPGESGDRTVERYVKAGVPLEKIVLGAAFYGRGWKGVKMDGTGFCQPYDGSAASYPYGRLARDLVDKNGYRRIWDRDAYAPYLVSADSAEVITYDDPASMQFKALYVREKGLGGVMFWVYNSDPTGVLLRTLHSYLSIR